MNYSAKVLTESKTIKFSPDMIARIEAAAEARRVPVATYMRQCILTSIVRPQQHQRDYMPNILVGEAA